MLKIYGNKESSSTKKVLYTAELLSLQFEFKDLDFQKDLKTPEYLKIHPAGKVPAIDDNGFILFESGAICRYLCDKNSPLLYPQDLKKRALINQWIDFCTLHVGAAIYKIVSNKVFAPKFNRPVDEMAIKQGEAECEKYLPIIENLLKKHKYIAGETLSLADITMFSTLEYVKIANIDISNYKAIVKWKQDLESQQFWKTWNE